MKAALAVRRLDKGDEKRLCELFCQTFGHGKNHDYWEWKHYKNPAGEHLTIVALDGLKVVGNIGSIPVRMKIGSSTRLATQRVDTVIAPDHRIVTTFFQLVGAAEQLMTEKNVPFTYGFTNQETNRINTEVLGFEEVCPIVNMSKVINPAPYLQRKPQMRLLARPLGIVGRRAVAMLNKKRLSIPPGLRISEVARFDHRFDDFWRREAKNYEIAVVRDSHYLNWRYVQCPTPYKIFCVESNECIRGFVVVGCYQEEIKRGRVLDILVDADQHEIIDLLLARTINYFLDQEVDVISCWMLEHWPIFDALKRKGFVPRETPHDLMVRLYAPDLANEYLADRCNWYITMGDSDYY